MLQDGLDRCVSVLLVYPFHLQADNVFALQYRWNVYKNIRQQIDENEGGMDKFTQGTNSCH